MTDGLRVTVIAYALGLAAICAAAAGAGRRRSPTVTAALVVLQVGVVLQAVIDVVALATGRHGPEVGVHLAYLVTSLVIVPLFAASVRFDARRLGNTALATGLAVLAIVSLRLDLTLGHP